VKVFKRNGSVEDFDPDKIARVVTAAGLKPQDGFSLALEVQKWVNSTNKDKISTLEIRGKVIAMLKKVDPNVANFFIWYEKGKDKIFTS